MMHLWRHTNLLSLCLKASSVDLFAFFTGDQYPSPLLKTTTPSTCVANSKHCHTWPHPRGPLQVKFMHTTHGASLARVTLVSIVIAGFVGYRRAMFIRRNMTQSTFSFYWVYHISNKLGSCHKYAIAWGSVRFCLNIIPKIIFIIGIFYFLLISNWLIL